MPLTPLPEDNTKRYKLIYTVGADEHAMTSRCSSSQSDGNALTYFADLGVAILPSCGPNVTWVNLEVAAQGSNVFNIVGGWTPAVGSAADDVDDVDKPRSVCFPGRTTGGRRTKVFVYGVSSGFVTPSTYDQDPLTSAGFQAFQGLLESQTDFWLGIDGIKPTWYFRCTIKDNDHWVDSRRG